MKRFIAVWILLSAGLNICQSIHIKKLEEKKPMVIYKADNAGAEIFGKVVEKGRHGKLYTITIRDYGIFVVTKEVYDTVKVGDEVRIWNFLIYSPELVVFVLGWNPLVMNV